MRDMVRETARIALALLLAFAVSMALVRLSGQSPSAALSALWSGAFGTPYDVGSTLTKTVPLLLTGLGVALAFRARLWNIGGEGQFLVGAIAASALGAYRFHHLPAAVLLPLVLIGGMLAGAAWSVLAGVLKTGRGVPEVISTIMLNFLAASVLSYLVHGPMQEATHAQPASEPLPPAATLPNLWPGTALHAGMFVAVLAVLAYAVFLAATRAGFVIRVLGANEHAARLAGVNVPLAQVLVLAASGGLCGLAGAVELSGVVGSLYENYAPGYGFAAIAVALLGRLNPWGIMLSALFFGALAAGSGQMERSAGVSHALTFVLQATLLLFLLGVPAWKRFRKIAALPANLDPLDTLP